jgi:hypothetical protein
MDEEICTQDVRAADRDPPLNRHPAVHAEGPRKGDGSSPLQNLGQKRVDLGRQMGPVLLHMFAVSD